MTISGIETWTTTTLPGDVNLDGHLLIQGTLRIPQDQRLIIEPGVHLGFGPNGKVIVERGGQLNADGATFTSACELMWQGIEVWGETDHAQGPFNGNTATGRAIITNSTIENARGAVRVYKPGSADHNGGVLWATGCNFFNNHMSIEVRATRNMINGVERMNYCFVNGCTFETNAFLLDPAYSDGLNRTAAAEHIRLVDVNNFRIWNSAFSTDAPGHTFPPHLRGTGIMGFNASFLASGCTFNGLSQGVWAANFPIPFRSVRVRNSTLTNTIHSVILQGTQYAEVTRNTIIVPGSPDWDYAIDDPDRGCNLPVGIYLLGSTEYNVEDNTITGSELDASNDIEHFSYGIVASESMYSEYRPEPDPGVPVLPSTTIDNRQSTASIFYNRMTALSVAMQLEGDNKGEFLSGVEDNEGYGLVVECNDMANGFENWWLDMAVVGNYIDDDLTYDGLLRDQGVCDAPDLQAGNTFSNCWGSQVFPEHLYFDSHTQFGDFRYADQTSKLPESVCTNIVDGLNRVECILLPTERICESTLDCDAPCLYERRLQVRERIQQVNDDLDNATDADEILRLQQERAYHRAQQRLIHSAEVRYYLEAENMDSLFVVIQEGGDASGLREKLYLFITEREYALADSMIDVIIAEEGGTPSAHTELVMLQLSLMNAQQSVADLSPAHKAMLEAMVAEDPLGAPSAKALLSLAFGNRFKRVPWMINDTQPGRAMWHAAPNEQTLLKVWPVPTNDVLYLESTADMRSATIFDATGRSVGSWAPQRSGLVQMDVRHLPEGVYVLRIELPGRTEHRSFTKAN